MTDTKKRKPEETLSKSFKKVKGRRQWQTPKRNHGGNSPYTTSFEPGISGIWATCDMHKEAKCTGDLIDLFNKQAEEFYGSREGEVESGDIEADIQREISKIQKPKDEKLFDPIRVDVKCGLQNYAMLVIGFKPTRYCGLEYGRTELIKSLLREVLFFKTKAPIEPVGFVHRICTDAFSSGRKQSRWVKRLTPMTLIGKATEKGLDEVAKSVLAPNFHGNDRVGKKFAIRTNIRNHNTLTRDGIIKQVAEVIGPGHKVDLKDYDLLVLVEIFQNICGMSVVPADFDQLRRYNLAEIHDARKNMSNQHKEK